MNPSYCWRCDQYHGFDYEGQKCVSRLTDQIASLQDQLGTAHRRQYQAERQVDILTRAFTGEVTLGEMRSLPVHVRQMVWEKFMSR